MTSRVATTRFTVQPTFAGPPFAANGGYVAGLLAQHLGTRQAIVTLEAPTPLGRALDLVIDDATAILQHGERRLARAARAMPVPFHHQTVDFVTASIAAGEGLPGRHPFPLCFVCGPERAPNEGLRLQPGEVGGGMWAVPWVPAAWQADPTGTVPLRLVTAALDRSSAFPVLDEADAALLAEISFDVKRLPRVGEHLVVTATAIKAERRRLYSSTAIHAPSGERLADARTLWIRIEPARLEALSAAV